MTRDEDRAGWIDVSVPIESGMPVWPGSPPVWLERVEDIQAGAAANVSVLSLSTHTATHMDAPLHFLEEATSIDEMPLDATLGPCQVVEVETHDAIEAEHLTDLELGEGDRVLFKTPNSERCWRSDTFVEDYVHLTVGAAEHLVDAGVRTVGVDYLSVGGFQGNGEEIHHVLLGGGVWIIEGLDLSAVEPGPHELVCLPLKVAGGDGAPARALLRPL